MPTLSGLTRLRNTTLAALLLCAAFSVMAAEAVDETFLARNLAATCTVCHSLGRPQTGTGIDALAGSGRSKLLQKLREYKDGTRPATIMHQISKGYSDEQLLWIADWYANQPK